MRASCAGSVLVMQLRPYQVRIIEDVRRCFRDGLKDVLVQSPTGSGKTALIVSMIKEATERKKTSWFIVHRKELLEQTSGAFSEQGVDHGILQSGVRERPSLVQVCSVQTLCRRLEGRQRPDLLVVDEAHHTAGRQWDDVFGYCRGSFRVGLTATPARLDGQGLGRWYQTVVRGPGVRELIGDGYLADYRLFAPSQPDLSRVKTLAGDYERRGLTETMSRPEIVGCAVNEYRRHADGKRAVVFAVSVEHSERVAQMFRDAGISAKSLSGETPHEERRRTVEEFRENKLSVLVNCDLFSEGFDVPGVEAAVLLRPTKSLALYLQQVGRALRPKPDGACATILDHSGNVTRHGFPCDPHSWSLEDREKISKKTTDPSVKICKNCFGAYRAEICPHCGFKNPAEQRDIKQSPGVLAELKRENFQRLAQERKNTHGFDELVALGRSRGYKNPWFWAQRVMQGRKSKHN